MRVNNRYHLVFDRGLLSRNSTSLGKKAGEMWKEDVKLRGGKKKETRRCAFMNSALDAHSSKQVLPLPESVFVDRSVDGETQSLAVSRVNISPKLTHIASRRFIEIGNYRCLKLAGSRPAAANVNSWLWILAGLDL